MPGIQEVNFGWIPWNKIVSVIHESTILETW